ncbi:hypothetical protein [Dokdonella immobilis]|uniref:SGNH hydrolase-type esterase domain-containing protein n=1 Tax=Dokdonella immobilis TaxID=578942 RepID=A0A1I4XQD4_9GAMM|nr:hypothetical protein [Dokdonella immobilis]SFN27469.1 hypothetical protein SAMN05216289_11116 [Dokdonella immobilis]
MSSMISRAQMRIVACTLLASLSMHAVRVPAAEPDSSGTETAAWRGPYPWNYSGILERRPRPALMAGACSTAPAARVLLAGDSWAQYMWDDDAHNASFDKFGQADHLAISRSLGSNPGPGYSGAEYAVSGSEAREWVDTGNYPWIANVVAELVAEPNIGTVMFSLGGNDILAGKSGGGWYKDMDLDVPGAEEALFTRILADSETIVDAITAVRPGVDVLVSSYEYPNFNVSALWCWIYACPKRRDLSRDPDNALVTDAEINAMNLEVESRRIAWTNANPRLHFDHGDGEMHHYYGDGVSAAGVLPRPGQQAPDYLPFPGGNPSRPSLRENFRVVSGIAADPIHLNPDGYLYKVAVQTESYFFPKFRGQVSQTLSSLGGAFDGWTDGSAAGTEDIAIGDDGTRLSYGLVSFDTSAIAPDAVIESASLYLVQEARSGSNPFVTGNLGAPRLDVAASFGAPEVEASDASAPADASNAGCFVGSADANYYALRIDLSPAALATIRRDGLTQFRIAFTNTDAGVNRVQFHDGDAPPLTGPEVRETVEQVEEIQADGSVVARTIRGTALVHRGVAEILGNARPFLDLRYLDLIFRDGFELPGGTGASVAVPGSR